MAKKAALGRGLAALLREESGDEYLEALTPPSLNAAEAEADASSRTSEASGGGVVELPITAIRRNPRQPRRAFDPAALEELATSIASVGVVQPVIVRRADVGYELIAGERRWRAAQQAGYTVIPAIIRSASDVESLELALVENVVRQQLNPVDEAFALRVLLEDLGVTQEKLAARVGKSRSAIANKVRLLDLPAPIQESLAAGTLSEGHARALLGLESRGEQIRMARRIAEKGLSVRQVEEEVRRKSEPPVVGKQAVESNLSAEVVDQIRDSFFGLLGVVPRVRGRGNGGVIELPFRDADELGRLLERLS
jgi:ParB family chromosome partitioning protein